MRAPTSPLTGTTSTRLPTGVSMARVTVTGAASETGNSTVSCARTHVQPSNREPLSHERFLSEAAMLHQTWIRRFDAQHRRRPRPPEIEAERLRLLRRLQLVQSLQQESAGDEELVVRLRELSARPREARLVEGDQPFLTALLQTWEAA